MTNKIESALKAAIDVIGRNRHWIGGIKAEEVVDLCKSALAEIEKCEPDAWIIADKISNKPWVCFDKAEADEHIQLGQDNVIAVCKLEYKKLSAADKEDMKTYQSIANNYTSPQPRECEDWQYFDKAYKKAAETSDATDWMNAALLAQQVRRKQLNTKG